MLLRSYETGETYAFLRQTQEVLERKVLKIRRDFGIVPSKMAAPKDTTFKFPSMATSFIKHLHDMRQRGQLCDLTVVVAGMQFPCHRAVLAASSSYFRSVLTGGDVPNELHLPSLKLDTFSKILDFMYTHRLTLNSGNAGEILVAATMLNLETVVDVCSQYLKRSMASMAMAVNSSDAHTAAAASSSTEGGLHERPRQVSASFADSQDDGIDYFGSSMSFQSASRSRVESPNANPHSTGSPHTIKDTAPMHWDAPMKMEPDQPDPSEDSNTSSTAGVEARSVPMQVQNRYPGSKERAVDAAGDGLQLQIGGVTSWSTEGNLLQRDESHSAAMSAAPTMDQYSPTLQVPGTAKRTDGLGKVYYACPVCDSTFTWKSSLQRHMHNHSMWRRHVCQVCGKSFARMDVLKDHMLLHLAEKPHKCDICGRKFTHKKNLKMHTMRHMGASPMTCKICHYRYATVAGLRNHMKIKHDTVLVEAESPDGDGSSPQTLAAQCMNMRSPPELSSLGVGQSSLGMDQNTPAEQSGTGPEEGEQQD